jgi:mRNA interferase MazF
MVEDFYIPEKGDLIWVSLDPQSGREQAGRRPAFVVTPYKYNKTVGLSILCPVTSQVKGYPFEVQIPGHLPVHGVILSDHLKSLDYRIRKSEFICALPKQIISEVLLKIKLLMFE